jgi:hypothetical protein
LLKIVVEVFLACLKLHLLHFARPSSQIVTNYQTGEILFLRLDNGESVAAAISKIKFYFYYSKIVGINKNNQ